MPEFSKTSRQRLESCHDDLQAVFNIVIQGLDCTILEGFRPEVKQNALFEQGKSKLKYPMSKHNRRPSWAVDVAPYPIDWGEKGSPERRRKALARFYYFAGYVQKTADRLGVRLRYGGDWDGDFDFSDNAFDDLVHYELVTTREIASR